MSRSRRLPVIKDKPPKRWYWRTIRRRWKQCIDINSPDFIEFPDKRSLINDWDYIDWSCKLMYLTSSWRQ